MNLARTLAAVASTAAVLFATACGGGGDPLGQNTAQPSGSAGDPVVVGSANFTESQILAELYSQALVAKGIESSTKPNIGSREVYIKALQDGSVSLVPEYTGNLLLYFDKSASATTAEEIEEALPAAVGTDLTVLAASEAADQDVYVVTKEFADQNQIASLADLKKISADSVLGGPSELETRAYGVPGLKSIYGATFKEFKPYDAPAVKVRDLNDNKIQVASFFTTEAAIIDNGYVQLEDPQSMILPQNIVPLTTSAVADNASAVDAIEAVQAALTTEQLTTLNNLVDVGRQDPDQVASDWLKSRGLG